jgi:hypothetical protein
MPKILFILYFYLAWFLCIFAGKSSHQLFALILPLPSFVFFFLNTEKKKEIFFKSFILLILGILSDVFGNFFGFIYFVPSTPFPFLPIWLLSMWLLYISYLPFMIQFFRKKYVLAFFLGAFFGPLSYLSGTKFDLIYFASKKSIFIYSLFWGFYFLYSLYLLNNKKSELQNENQ